MLWPVFYENTGLTLAGAADVRCFPVFAVTGGGAGSTGGRTLGGTMSSLLVTSGTSKKKKSGMTLWMLMTHKDSAKNKRKVEEA